MRRVKRRPAISEVLGSLIMIAITLIAGAAVFGFINGQSGNSAQAVGNSAATNINFLNEKFVISAAVLSSSSSSGSIYVYNNGNLDLTIQSIVITGPSLSVQFTDAAKCGLSSGIYCFSDSGTPLCNSYLSANGFAVSRPQPEPFKNNVPLPLYSFAIPTPVTCGSIAPAATYTITLTGLYGNVVSVPVVAA